MKEYIEFVVGRKIGGTADIIAVRDDRVGLKKLDTSKFGTVWLKESGRSGVLVVSQFE